MFRRAIIKSAAGDYLSFYLSHCLAHVESSEKMFYFHVLREAATLREPFFFYEKVQQVPAFESNKSLEI